MKKQWTKYTWNVGSQIDNETPPKFEYVDGYIYSDALQKSTEDDSLSCKKSCKFLYCNAESKKCCHHIHEYETDFAYNDEGTLKLPPKWAIYECNACKCAKYPDQCDNRVVQNGSKQEFCIFKTDNRGWAIRTETFIKNRTFVIAYAGEVITFDEAERRGKDNIRTGACNYLFDLDCDSKGKDLLTVDAAKRGNISRFCNHSSEPNMAIRAAYTDCFNPKLHKRCFFCD